MEKRTPLVLAVADLAYSGGEIFELLKIFVDRDDFRLDLQSVPLTQVIETARRRKPALIIIGHRPLLFSNSDRERWESSGSIVGGDLIRALKSDPETSEIPVLLLEGSSDVGKLAQTFGADAFLKIPAFPREFVDVIQEMIQTEL